MSQVLDGTPYLFEAQRGPAILSVAQKLAEDVGLLRRRGTLDEATLQGLRREWQIEQVYESAGIEGNELDLNETRMAIQRGMTISGKPPEHAEEVRHLHAAHEYLERLVNSSEPIGKRELLDIHTLVLGRGEADAGAYRVVEVAISGSKHKPSLPVHVAVEMDHYLSWLERAKECPVPLQAAIAHAWLVHIHPFRDGNGRTARAFMNLIFMRNGFPIVVLRRKDRPRYYEALGQSDGGDIGPLLELLVERSHDSLKQIDRVRHAHVRMSLAMERVLAADERKVGIWNATTELLCEQLADAFAEPGEKDPSFTSDWRRYESLDVEQYRHLCKRETVSDSWQASFRLERHGKSFQMLLWAGYPSGAPHGESQPTLVVSEPNPTGLPRWRRPAPDYATTAREIAFENGRFAVLRDKGRRDEFDTAKALALTIVQEVLERVFA